MRLILWLSLIFFLILLTVGLFFAYHFYYPQIIDESVVIISRGDNASIISKKLFSENVIKNPDIFLLYLKLSKKDTDLSHGMYIFKGKMNLNDVVDKLVNARVELQTLTIPEGLNLNRTINLLSRNGFGDREVFYQLVNDSSYVKSLTGLEINSLEGFLYPNTYRLPWEVSEDFMLRFLVRQFFEHISELDFSNPYNLSFYEVIILASIVEREAVFDDEKPLIASVYLNRIEIGKRLQADPTVAYALEKRNINRRMIFYRDLEIDSPYNTYRNDGLPPTPICSPSLSSIKAVLEPEDSDYFFFFANNRGRHIFTRTYREHLEKQRILRSK